MLKALLKLVAGLFGAKATTTTQTTQVSDTTSQTVLTTSTAPADVNQDDVEKAIAIVNNIRAALASPVAVLITDLIPGDIDDVIREELVNDLPVIVAGLANIQSVIQTADKSAVINALLSQIKLSPNFDLDNFYHGLAARLLTKITKGGVIWSIAVVSVEYVFKKLWDYATGKAETPAPAAPATPAAASPLSVVTD
jgi:hypothetical protein